MSSHVCPVCGRWLTLTYDDGLTDIAGHTNAWWSFDFSDLAEDSDEGMEVMLARAGTVERAECLRCRKANRPGVVRRCLRWFGWWE